MLSTSVAKIDSFHDFLFSPNSIKREKKYKEKLILIILECSE